MDVVHLLRRYRRATGLTQAELAELLDVEQASVSRWERGVHEPDSASMRKLRLLLQSSGIGSDAFILNRISNSPFACKIANRGGENLAASSAAAELHGVGQNDLAHANYWPLYTDALIDHWKKAVEIGFFVGDVESIQVCNTWLPLSGAPPKLCMSYWTPAKLSDGEILLVSEFRVLECDMEKSIPQSFVARPMQLSI